MTAAPDRACNALTVDVEDWFQVSAMARYIDRDAWERQPCRVEGNVERILAMLQATPARATFFTLGWVADRYPGVVRAIVAAGHELASHGYAHRRATEQTPAEFLADITRAKHVLEDVGGVGVRGYRAPSFSIGRDNVWALDAVQRAGYAYSSSIYPIAHDHYGMPEAPRVAFRPRDHALLELPATAVRLLHRNWPAAGGGYFRLLPYPVSRWLIRRFNAAERSPAIFYFHPWEIDPGQPRVEGLDALTRFRHYLNLGRVEARLRRLLSDFRWDRLDRVFAEQIAEPRRAAGRPLAQAQPPLAVQP